MGGGGDSAQTSLCPLPVFRALHSTELKLVVERGGEKSSFKHFYAATGVLSTRNTADSGRAVPVRSKTGKKGLVVSCAIRVLWGGFTVLCP